MCCLFVYLHLMHCLHVLYATPRLSRLFVPANHRQLSLPSNAWKSLEKVVVYKGTTDKEKNSCKPTGLWLGLVPSQYRTSSVIGGGPIMEDEGNLTVENPSGRQPFVHNKHIFIKGWLYQCFFRSVKDSPTAVLKIQPSINGKIGNFWDGGLGWK